MDGFRICLALFFIICGCDKRSETALSLTTKLAIIRGLGMSSTSRFRKSGRRTGLAERSICIYRCPACQFVSLIYYWSFDSFGFSESIEVIRV